MIFKPYELFLGVSKNLVAVLLYRLLKKPLQYLLRKSMSESKGDLNRFHNKRLKLGGLTSVTSNACKVGISKVPIKLIYIPLTLNSCVTDIIPMLHLCL